jgi:hypothetical protein
MIFGMRLCFHDGLEEGTESSVQVNVAAEHNVLCGWEIRRYLLRHQIFTFIVS